MQTWYEPTSTSHYSGTTLYYKVLLCTTPVLLCTTQYYNVLLCTTKYYASSTPVLLSTTKYYNVLLQYYSVLQSTTPVLLCTTKYYASTTLYYKVLQRTTPVLLCTTKYYSGTTLYYKVLLCTTPVLLCTTQYYNVLLCTTKYYASTTLYYASTTTYYSGTTLKRHLQCAAQQESPPNFTKYCACHAKWMSSMICVTYETSFPMRGASQVTLQPHQILRLPRKMNVVDDLRHIWNVISNARSQSSYLQPHQIPRLPRQESPPNFTKYLGCHAKWMSSMICVTYETSFPMRGASQVTLQPHQILRLPRKMNVVDDLRHIWNVISNAWSQSSHPPTSPNTAPATKSSRSRFARKIPEVLPPIERRFDHNPRISDDIRA